MVNEWLVADQLQRLQSILDVSIISVCSQLCPPYESYADYPAPRLFTFTAETWYDLCARRCPDNAALLLLICADLFSRRVCASVVRAYRFFQQHDECLLTTRVAGKIRRSVRRPRVYYG